MSDTRAALLDAAVQLLEQGGTEAVTLREIGRIAGVSHNAPYKHFADKEALLATIAARDLAWRNESARAAIADVHPPDAALRKVLHDHIDWALDHPVRFKLIFGTRFADSPELAAAAFDTHTTLVHLVAAMQAAGQLPAGDPVRLAALLWALAHGAADLATAGHLGSARDGQPSPGELADDLLDQLRATARTTRRHAPSRA